MGTVGERIRNIRKSNGLTQQEFGDIFGLSASHVGSVEGDRKKPSDMFLRFVAYRFGIEYEYIKTGEHSKDIAFTDRQLKAQVTSLYNFIFDNLRDTLTDEQLQHFIFRNLYPYTLLVGCTNLFPQQNCDSTDYVNYLDCLNTIFIQLMSIVSEAEGLIISSRQKETPYNKYKEQVAYMSMFDNATNNIVTELKKISNIHFDLINSDITFNISNNTDDE